MKKTVAIAALILASQLTFAALSVNWSGTGTQLSGVPNTPLAESLTAGWLVQLYRATDVGSDLGTITGFDPLNGFLPVYDPAGGPDVLQGGVANTVYNTTLVEAKGDLQWAANNLDWDAIAGSSVYTVLFNHADINSASWAYVVEGSPFTLLGDGGQAYQPFAQTGAGENNWVPVPEPGTVMLGLAGLAILGSNLRKRGKKA